jgi:hypothetical protein
MTYIYLVEKCYGDINKVYIGKSVNPKSRKNQHLKKYGRSIRFTVVDQVPSNLSKDWKPVEAFYIQYFKFLGFEVMNQNNGGGGCIGGMVPWNKGLKLGNNPKITSAKMNHPDRSKPILQYTLGGSFIKEYPSIMEARRDNPKGDIDGCVQGKQKQAGGFQWWYRELNIKTEIGPYIKTRKSKFSTLEEKKHAKKMTDSRYYQTKKLKSTTNTLNSKL